MVSECVLVAEYVMRMVEVDVCCSNSEQYAVGVYAVSVGGLNGAVSNS